MGPLDDVSLTLHVCLSLCFADRELEAKDMEEPRNESEVAKLKKALENAEKALKEKEMETEKALKEKDKALKEKEKALKEKEVAENKYKQLISSPVKVSIPRLKYTVKNEVFQ